MKIQYKLTLFLLVIGFAIVIFIGLLYSFQNYQISLEHRLDDIKFTSESLSVNLDKDISDTFKTVVSLSSAPILKNTLIESNEYYSSMLEEERKTVIDELNKIWIKSGTESNTLVQSVMENNVADFFKEQHKHFPNWYGEIFLTNKYGLTIASDHKLTTLAQSQKYWWQAAYNNGVGKEFIDDRGYDESVGDYVLGFTIPINDGKEIIGIFKCNIKIMDLLTSNLISYEEMYSDIKFIIARTKGLIVSEPGIEPLSKSVKNPIANILSNDASYNSLIELEKEKNLMAISPIRITQGSKEIGFGGSYEDIDHILGNTGESWSVVSYIKEKIALSDFYKTNRQLIIYGFIFIIIFAFISWYLSKIFTNPVNYFIKTVEEIGKGDFQKRIHIKSKDQRNDLAKAINTMAENLQNTSAKKEDLEKEIFQRHTAQQNERDTREMFEKFMNYLPAGVFIKDKETKNIYINKFIEDTLANENWIGKTSKEIFPGKIGKKLEHDDKKVLKNGFLEKNEELIDKKGNNRYFQTYEFKIRRESGDDLIGGIYLDRTHEIITQKELIERKRLIEVLGNNIPGGMIWQAIFDENENPIITYISKQVEDIFGYTTTQVLRNANLMIERIFNEDRIKVLNGYKKCRNTLSSFDDEIRIHCPLKTKWFRIIVNPELSNGKTIWNGLLLDIDKRKKAEEEIKKSEIKFRNYIEKAPEGIFIADERGRYLEVNEEASVITGFSKEELLNMQVTDLLPEYAKKIGFDHFQKVVNEGEVEGVIPFIKKNGEKRYWNVKAVKLSEKRFLGFVKDVTDDENNKKTLQNIFENISNVFYMHDTNHLISYISPQIEEITGYSQKESYIKWKDFLSDNPLNQRGIELTERAIKTGKTQPTYEFELVHKDGHRVWVEVRETPIVENGKTVSLVGSLTDITKRKVAQDNIKKSEEKYKRLITEMSQGVALHEIILDKEGNPFDYRFLEINDSFEKLTGLKKEEIIGKNILSILPKTEKHWIETYGKVAVTGEPIQIDYYSIEFDKYFSVAAYSPKKGQFVTVFTDTTERKKVFEKIKNNQELFIKTLQRVVELRDPYTSGHQERVAELGIEIAKRMGLSLKRIDGVRIASLLHDNGKIYIPTQVLNKAAKLTHLEYSMVQEHTKYGYELLKDMEFDTPVPIFILQHHERLDGSGYPNGLKEKDIHLESQIIGVADVIEAICSHRPYRPALGLDVAFEEIKKYSGTKYNPDIVKICLDIFKDGFIFSES